MSDDLDQLLAELHASPSPLEVGAKTAISVDVEPATAEYSDAVAEMEAMASAMNDEIAAGCSQERAHELVQQLQDKRRALAAIAPPADLPRGE